VTVLAPWSNFFVVIGSAAATLTGLVFIVITLVSGREASKRNPLGIAAFTTPTVVHFGAALLVSALALVPWPTGPCLAVVLAVAGVAGITYIVRLALLSRQLTQYEPDVEDWSWYTIMPIVAYTVLLAGAFVFPVHPQAALFPIAGSALLLIFAGLHNAWDIVTYITTDLPD
jgi:hypothetical protein